MRLPPRVVTVERSTTNVEPHEFVQSTSVIRVPGAPMRNPPQPEDTMVTPYCKVCQRRRKDPIHTVPE